MYIIQMKPVFKTVCLALFISVVGCTITGSGRTADMPRLNINSPMSPPPWAVLERKVFEQNTEALHIFAEKYYDERGYLKVDATLGGGAGADDSTEPTNNWGLLYALGGDEYVLQTLRKAWEGHYQQYTEAGGLHEEFIRSFDWQHNGEQYRSFYDLGLCDPCNEKYRERVCRFADFYLGMPNYNPNKRLIRSVLNGSAGPIMNATLEDWGGQDFFKYWTGVKVRGDTPLNMQSTSLVTTAFLISGEKKYRDWVKEYGDAWVERARANNGIFPGNVGLNGKPGEDWPHPAKQFPEYVPKGSEVYPWAGGVMGWSGWGGPHMVMSGVRMGLKNAFLLTANDRYLEAGRRQIEHLRKGMQIGVKSNGKPLTTDGSGQKQWFAEDLYLLRPGRYEDYFRQYWGPGQGHDQPHYEMGYTLDWIAWLDGENANFPESILKKSLKHIDRRVRKIRADKSIDWERECNLTGKNPVATAALTMLTTGGRQPSWRGSLLFARLRYFDPDRGRPGLPPDVGALVDRIRDEEVHVTLVNLSTTTPRTVVVQGGAYAEHQITEIAVTNGPSRKINGRAFVVKLQPGAGAKIRVQMKRFVRRPTLSYPWGPCDEIR